MHAPGLLFMNLTWSGKWANNKHFIPPRPPAICTHAALDNSTYPLHVAVQTENVEDSVGIHLGWVEAVHHDDWRLCVGAVLSRGRRGRAVLSSVPLVWPTPTRAHWRPDTPSLIVAIIMVAMITLRATYSTQIPRSFALVNAELRDRHTNNHIISPLQFILCMGKKGERKKKQKSKTRPYNSKKLLWVTSTQPPHAATVLSGPNGHFNLASIPASIGTRHAPMVMVFPRESLTVLWRVVSQQSRLSLALVGVGIHIWEAQDQETKKGRGGGMKEKGEGEEKRQW